LRTLRSSARRSNSEGVLHSGGLRNCMFDCTLVRARGERVNESR
jgi:hypothetical protein